MTEDIRKQLERAGFKPAVERKAPKTASASPGKTAAQQAKEKAACTEIAKVGRYEGKYTGFGLTQPYRKYVLLNDEQARQLDAAFAAIVNQ